MSKGDGAGAGLPSSLPRPPASVSFLSIRFLWFDQTTGIRNHCEARARGKYAVMSCTAVRTRTLPSTVSLYRSLSQLNGNGMNGEQCRQNRWCSGDCFLSCVLFADGWGVGKLRECGKKIGRHSSFNKRGGPSQIVQTVERGTNERMQKGAAGEGRVEKEAATKQRGG
jgi:hypothetical protein